MKKLIRLTESDLHRVVKESVKRILKEYDGSLNPNPHMANSSIFDELRKAGYDSITIRHAKKIVEYIDVNNLHFTGMPEEEVIEKIKKLAGCSDEIAQCAAMVILNQGPDRVDYR